MASDTETRAVGALEGRPSRLHAPEPEISVVVPVFNEEGNLAALHQELTAALEPFGKRYEILFVDDGSTDASFALLKSLHHRDERVRVVRFRKNFGQTAALAAGFAEARAPVIVTLDADLQNDPKDIPRLVERLDAGFDIVCGWRKDRKDAYLARTLPSQIANWLISVTTGVHLHDYGCTLKAFRSEVVKNLQLYGEMHRFIPAVASGFGVSIDEMVVGHRERRAGQSKYGISRTVRVVLDLITVKFLLDFSHRPLQVFGLAGLSAGAVGFALGCYLTWVKFGLGQPIAGRPLLLLAALLMVFGVQLVSLGLLGELQARSYHENSAPRYAIREKLSVVLTSSSQFSSLRLGSGVSFETETETENRALPSSNRHVRVDRAFRCFSPGRGPELDPMDRGDVRPRVLEEENLLAVDELPCEVPVALGAPLETDAERPGRLPGAERAPDVDLPALGNESQPKPTVVDGAAVVQLLETHAESISGHVASEARVPHEEEMPGVPRGVADVEAFDVELEKSRLDGRHVVDDEVRGRFDQPSLGGELAAAAISLSGPVRERVEEKDDVGRPASLRLPLKSNPGGRGERTLGRSGSRPRAPDRSRRSRAPSPPSRRFALPFLRGCHSPER